MDPGWVGGLDEIKAIESQLCWSWGWGWAWQFPQNLFNNLSSGKKILKVNQLDCSPAPTCQIGKQNSNPTWGCNVYYWIYKFNLLLILFLLGLINTNHAISLMLLVRTQPNFEGWLVGLSVFAGHYNICPSFTVMARQYETISLFLMLLVKTQPHFFP